MKPEIGPEPYDENELGVQIIETNLLRHSQYITLAFFAMATKDLLKLS